MMIPSWALYLDPWLDLAALAVCLYYRRLSRHMVWLIVAYGVFCSQGLLLPVLEWSGSIRSPIGRRAWDTHTQVAPALYDLGWVCLVIGLFAVLGSLSARLHRGQGAAQAAAGEGLEPEDRAAEPT